MAEDELARLQEEYEAFQRSSKELEEELEADLAKAESESALLRQRNSELEALILTNAARNAETAVEVTRMQQETLALREAHEALLVRSRELEHAADVSEERQRRAEAEAAHLREQLERAVETTSFAHTELEDLRRESQEHAERSREELFDLRHELERLTPIKAPPRPHHERTRIGDDADGGGGGVFLSGSYEEEDEGDDKGSNDVNGQEGAGGSSDEGDGSTGGGGDGDDDENGRNGFAEASNAVTMQQVGSMRSLSESAAVEYEQTSAGTDPAPAAAAKEEATAAAVVGLRLGGAHSSSEADIEVLVTAAADEVEAWQAAFGETAQTATATAAATAVAATPLPPPRRLAAAAATAKEELPTGLAPVLSAGPDADTTPSAATAGLSGKGGQGAMAPTGAAAILAGVAPGAAASTLTPVVGAVPSLSSDAGPRRYSHVADGSGIGGAAEAKVHYDKEMQRLEQEVSYGLSVMFPACLVSWKDTVMLP
ncbi:unnamed protein product [Phaeothamnion confervicola]